MNVSLKKVNALWHRLDANRQLDIKQALRIVVNANDDVIEYATNLFGSLAEIWKYELPAQLKNSSETAYSRGCAVGIDDGGSDKVKQLLVVNSKDIGDEADRIKCRELVWNKLSAIKADRDPRFRVSSNAGGFSEFETFNTTCCMLNPDPWLYSYNFPWHVISWLQDVHRGIAPSYNFVYDDNREEVLDKRFVYKYLWLIADESVIPILSIRSFLNLRPFFKEVWKTIEGREESDFAEDFGLSYGQNGHWTESYEDFRQDWRVLSDAIRRQLGVTDEEFPKVRERLASFLFALSLTDESRQDLGTLLERGNKAVILYGPPGTGKTYAAKNYIFGALGIDAKNPETNMKRGKDGAISYSSDQGEVTLVQFHPNYTYQDFVGGIFPGVDPQDKTRLFYETREGVFKRICDEAAKPGNGNRKYYLLIDEINRADLSSVFGELMYGLEYRGFTMSIPTFGEFKIPENVYIVGTMNNTDKSLVGFDLALRRRFAFLAVPPDMDVLSASPFVSEKGTPALSEDENAVPVSEQFAERAVTLNASLHEEPFGFPQEKEIGHAYFLRVKDFCERVDCTGAANPEGSNYVLTGYALEQLWLYHIRPLLEEYIGLEFEDRKDDVSRLMKEFCAEFE